MLTFHPEQMREYLLTRMQSCVQQRLSRQQQLEMSQVELSTYIDYMTQDMLVRLTKYCWTHRIAEVPVKTYSSWWDHTKARWFPAWALKRWPAKEKNWGMYHCYDAYPALELNVPGGMKSTRISTFTPFDPDESD